MARGVLLPLLALLSAALTGVFLYDLRKTTAHPSGCEMTYSWPVYTPLAWSKASHHKYTLYSVHMKERREELTGVPVLFLPGHLGSYKQARSIARHLFDANEQLFDVFAVDFQEELTGLSGNFVSQQAQYVNDAIRAILRQYKKQQHGSLKKRSKGKKVVKPTGDTLRIPESVVIVAHSMGGVVTRLAETLPNYTPRSIQHVISLGSPYHNPPFPFDVEMQAVYAKITTTSALLSPGSSSAGGASIDDEFTNDNDDGDDDSTSPVYVSIAGGHKDMIVHASLSATDRVAHPKRSLASLTTAMPGVQLTMDHLCLLWCHQLLDRIAQSLVAVVDVEKRELVKSPSRRLELSRNIILGDSKGSNEVNATTVLLHREHVRDGYHSEEFATYGLLLPQLLFHVLRTSYATLFVIMFALMLHILSLQVAHWQSAFNLQTTPDAQKLQAQQPKFPAFTSMLHPLAHAPIAFKRAFAAVIPEQMQSTVLAVLSAVVVGAVGLLVEYGRRNPVFAAKYAFLLELFALYLYAIGLLYAVAQILSVVRMLVVSPVVSALTTLLASPRGKKVQRWTIIGAIYALVFAVGQVQSVAPFEMVAAMDSARNLALLVLAAFIVFSMYLAGLGGNVSTSSDQQSLQRSLFALYALSVIPWVGKLLFFVDIVRFPPPVLSNDLLLHGMLYIIVLSCARYVVTFSQEWMLPMPPTAFFGAATGQDAGSAYDNDDKSSSSSTSSSSSKSKITAETCPKCVFEDGGPGAILVEYTNASTKRLVCNGELVLVGPSFRVVSCDCVFRFERPRDFCEFCTRSCGLCGGGSGNFQQAHQYKDFLVESQNESATHALVPLVFELLAIAQIAFGLRQCEHLAFYFTPVCTVALLVYHLVLLTTVEAKRRKNKLNKAKKKKRKSKSKTTSTTTSSNSTSSAPTSAGGATKTSAAPDSAKKSEEAKTKTASTTTSIKSGGTKKDAKKKQSKPNPNVPESLFVNPIYEMVEPSE